MKVKTRQYISTVIEIDIFVDYCFKTDDSFIRIISETHYIEVKERTIGKWAIPSKFDCALTMISEKEFDDQFLKTLKSFES